MFTLNEARVQFGWYGKSIWSSVTVTFEAGGSTTFVVHHGQVMLWGKLLEVNVPVIAKVVD